MKKLLSTILILLLSGCAAGTWYKAETTNTAKLRAVALDSPNALVAVIPNASCEPKQETVLGWFHPSAESFQASRRGFDRRTGIPLGEAYPNNQYSEHLVDASKPIVIFSKGLYWVGPTLYSFRECKKVATFSPLTNHDYEVVFTSAGKECNLSLFEIKNENGNSQRVKAKFDSEEPSCNQ